MLLDSHANAYAKDKMGWTALEGDTVPDVANLWIPEVLCDVRKYVRCDIRAVSMYGKRYAMKAVRVCIGFALRCLLRQSGRNPTHSRIRGILYDALGW